LRDETIGEGDEDSPKLVLESSVARGIAHRELGWLMHDHRCGATYLSMKETNLSQMLLMLKYTSPKWLPNA
jgi:hypothetical protein